MLSVYPEMSFSFDYSYNHQRPTEQQLLLQNNLNVGYSPAMTKPQCGNSACIIPLPMLSNHQQPQFNQSLLTNNSESQQDLVVVVPSNGQPPTKQTENNLTMAGLPTIVNNSITSSGSYPSANYLSNNEIPYSLFDSSIHHNRYFSSLSSFSSSSSCYQGTMSNTIASNRNSVCSPLNMSHLDVYGYFGSSNNQYCLAPQVPKRRSSSYSSYSSSSPPPSFTYHSDLSTVRSSSPTATNKKYGCHICNKRFTRPSSLTTHIYSHTGEKPFKCLVEGCGRSFSVVSNLRRHAKVHGCSNTNSSTSITHSP